MIASTSDPLRPEDVRAAEIKKALDRGWRLIPMRGKRPVQKDWPNRPPLSADELLAHAKHGNIGLLTGQDYGLVVLDDDTKDQSLATQFDLPPTVTVRTGSGRLHYYFFVVEPRLGNRCGRLPKGVDVRGHGGVVVFVGSQHPDTGGIYEWLPGHSPDEVEIAELPAHVIDLITVQPKRTTPAKEHTKRRSSRREQRLQSYAATALSCIVSEVVCAADGERNDALNLGAFAIGKLVGPGLLPRGRVEAELTTAAAASGLSKPEIEATIRSGLDAGIVEALSLDELEKELNENLLGLPPADQDPRERPIVVLVDGERHHAVDAAMDVLREQDPPLVYDQLGHLVCLVSTPTPTTRHRHELKRAVHVRPLDSDYLPDLLGRLIRFRRKAKDEELVPKNCPVPVARIILARAAHGRFVPLNGVIRTPTLRPDGTLLTTPGYDAETGLFLDIEPGMFDGTPEHPTLEDARRALSDLKEPFAEFDFETDADRAVFLAALLTPFVRWHLRTAPMFVITAPRRGSGKTLLARSVALLATGHSPWTVAQAHSEDEERKRWFAMLLANAAIVNIDNVEAPLGGTTLCALLTEDRLSDRVLGLTHVRSASTTNVVILATGNNVEFSGDITRRLLLCSIDPGVEFPEDRTFRLNLDQHLLDNRPRLVVAALTFLRAFVEAGHPRPDVRPFGSFESWSDFVRAALIWVGEPDPCETRSRIEERDPRRDHAEALLVAWHETLGDREATAHEAISAAVARDAKDEPSALSLALLPVCGEVDGRLDVLALGRWLRSVRNRVERGYRVEAAGRTHGRQRWRVSRV